MCLMFPHVVHMATIVDLNSTESMPYFICRPLENGVRGWAGRKFRNNFWLVCLLTQQKGVFLSILTENNSARAFSTQWISKRKREREREKFRLCHLSVHVSL